MCINPTVIDGKEHRCRHCWQCISKSQDDVVGRCIAESRIAKLSLFVTLTFANAKEAYDEDGQLNKKLVSKFVRALRKRYRPIHFLYSGEFGKRFNRPHFHVILFFCGDRAPDLQYRNDKAWPEKKNFRDRAWKFGHMWAEKLHYKNARYVIKYAFKARDEKQPEHKLKPVFGRSTRPALGAEYFREFARIHVKQGLAPRNAEYWFDNVMMQGQRRFRKFRLHGAALRDYVQAYFDEWAKLRPGEDPPHSVFLQEQLDKADPFETPIAEIVADKRKRRNCPIAPLHRFFVGFDEKKQNFFCYRGDQMVWLEREADGRFVWGIFDLFDQVRFLNLTQETGREYKPTPVARRKRRPISFQSNQFGARQSGAAVRGIKPRRRDPPAGWGRSTVPVRTVDG